MEWKPEPQIHLPGPLEKMVVQRDAHGQRHSFHTPLGNPRWLASTDDAHMRPSDTILGLALEEGAWAIPWWIIKNHHVANFILQNLPVMTVL